MRLIFNIFIFILLIALPVKSGYALTADETLIVVNNNAWHSSGLGKYYMKKRAIPKDNFITLWTTDKEVIVREEYEKQIAEPLRAFLAKKEKEGKKIHCLVLMYGMPLKIAPPEFTKAEKQELSAMQKEQDDIKLLLAKLNTEDPEYEKLADDLQEISASVKKIEVTQKNKSASLDSELSLLRLAEYPLEGWVGNPLFIPFQRKKMPAKPEDILLVSRLDGPNEKTVKRMIDDAIKAEEKGLQGTAYFDARWKAPDENKAKRLKGYGYYDWSIHLAAAFFKKQNIMPTILDNNEKLFQEGDASDAAIYCGWYSLANYVDAFEWQPGAVGFHIASGECVSLKTKNNQWCRKILEEGAAATLGPVGEPYLQSFPIPEMFFKLLTEGRYSLVETYYLSLPTLSWKMVLIGDPLYRPFKKRHQEVN